MSGRKIARANGLGFFFFWLLVLLAGMDKPPPRGFSWVRLIVAICAALSPIFSIVVGAAVAVRCVINPLRSALSPTT